MLLEQNNIVAQHLQEFDKTKSSAKLAARRSDQVLQISRRIDWRFLLPEPYLRRVAYLGPDNGTLSTALRHFCDSLEIISPSSEAAQAPAKQSGFDLVVLRWRRLADLERACALLVAGGYLYWEIDRPRLSEVTSLHVITKRKAVDRSLQNLKKRKNRWRRSLGLVRYCVGVLERLGFGEIEAHWHRPNFERCLEIIPLHDRPALDYVFSRPRGDLANRLKLTSGRYVMKTGLLSRLVPCFSLIARRL
jgi:hypothetical protein